jgi:hypothetical protein
VTDAVDAAVRLSFVRGYGFSSGWISRLTGFWTHVDCVFDDGTLWGARSDRVGDKPAGVQGRRADYEEWEHRLVFAIPCTTLQAQSYQAFYKSQEGKPYDWLAIVNNFGFGYDYRTPDHWFCSDIATVSGESSDLWGIPDRDGKRELAVSSHGTSPGMLAMLVSGLPAVSIISSY